MKFFGEEHNQSGKSGNKPSPRNAFEAARPETALERLRKYLDEKGAEGVTSKGGTSSIVPKDSSMKDSLTPSIDPETGDQVLDINFDFPEGFDPERVLKTVGEVADFLTAAVPLADKARKTMKPDDIAELAKKTRKFVKKASPEAVASVMVSGILAISEIGGESNGAR